MSGGAKGKQQLNTRLFCSWKQHGYRIDGKGALVLPAEQLGSLACFRSHQCCRGHIRRQAMGMFRDKSTFLIHKHPIWRNAGNSVQIPHATLGPDEPYVASTAWPETAHEKQDLGFWTEAEKAALEGFLGSQLPPHPKLQRGQLKNGLRYIILPNKIPVHRFEAHIEVHVGSIDEEDDEQGIAHMIEHVAFLGSKKREKLLGTGARSNAYTDFHHTVFHIHSPTSTKEDLLPSVLDALNEIAFHPKFLESRVEKERRAILSELQMMNTIEYRVDCQLLQHLHSENKLSKRFPIGLEEQIKKWDSDKIHKFHERWYFPANATLHLVGDIVTFPRLFNKLKYAVFERTLEDNGSATVQSPSAFGAMASFLVPKLPGGLAGSRSVDRSSISLDQQKLTKKERYAVRPPIEHNWSLPGFDHSAKLPEIFQHELIQHVSINMFCKDISCIKDLNALYEAATIEDIYIAYEHLKVDDASLFSCIGVAGVQSGEDALGAADEVLDIDHQVLLPLAVVYPQ